MHPDKSPGPGGLNPAFYQKFWSTVGDNIFEAGRSCLDQHFFPPCLNDTNVCLISKVDHVGFLRGQAKLNKAANVRKI